jgi:D-alanine-D-alanine ligase-like ATP-grasp enzyme
VDEDPRRTAFEHRVVVIHTDADVTPNREPVTIHTRWLIGSALRRAGYEPFELPVTRRSDLDELATTHRGSMIFNLCYGFEAADGSLDQAEVAETLERRGLALVGSGGAAQHTCQDKLATAAVAGQLGIASPRTLSPEEATHATGPLVVKPRRGAAHREVRLATAATVARNPPGPEMIVQEYVDGPEYSIAVVDTGLGAPTVLPSMRIRYGRTRDRPALYDWATTTFAADSSSRFGLDELALALF